MSPVTGTIRHRRQVHRKGHFGTTLLIGLRTRIIRAPTIRLPAVICSIISLINNSAQLSEQPTLMALLIGMKLN